MLRTSFSNKTIYYLSIIFVLLFGFLIIITNDNTINRDGVGYLMQSALVGSGQEELAQTLYHNLFFSKLLLFIHNLTNLSLHHSSMLFNLSSLFGISIAFFGILSHIKFDKLIYLAGLLVLISSSPLMDKYLSMTLRDPGMWFAVLIGLYFLVRFISSRKPLNFALSLLFIIIGSLFRLECIAFVLIPFAYLLFYFKFTSPAKYYKIILTLTFFIFLSSLATLFLVDLTLFDNNSLYTRLHSFFSNFFKAIPLTTNHLWLKEHVADYKNTIKFSVLTSIFLQKWIVGLGITHLILAFIGLRSDLIGREVRVILIVFLVFSALLVFINFIATYSISARYFMLCYLVIYLFSAVGLYTLFFKINDFSKLKRAGFYFILFLLSFQILDNLIDKKTTNNHKIAANWLLENKIDLNNCFVSDMRVRYYMQSLTLEKKLLADLLRESRIDYLVLNEMQFDLLNDSFDYKPIISIPNKISPKIIIYKKLKSK